MAEWIMKDLVSRAGLSADFIIDSAALTTEEIGRDMYPPAKKILSARGIPFAPRRARLMTVEDYEKSDLVLAMDEENLRHLRRLIGPDRAGKIHLLMEYADEHREVADPWYTGDFETTYNDIRRAAEGLLRSLKFKV